MDVDWATWAPMIPTTALVLITIYYAWLVQKQVRRDERLDDPELQVFMGKVEYYDTGAEKGSDRWSIRYTAVVINPGLTPVVVTSFEEKASQEEDPSFALKMRSKFDIPEERPVRVFVGALPWVIGARDFAVWRRRFPPELWDGSAIVKGVGYRVDVSWKYQVGDKEKTASGTSQTGYWWQHVC